MVLSNPDACAQTDILVVEADVAVGESMETLFKTAGYTVSVVHDTHSAEAAVRSCLPLCLVIAAELTPNSGVDWLSTQRKLGVAIPAIVIASRGDVPTAVAAMRAGASDFLEKPLIDARLLQSVRRIMSNSGSQVKAN